ncbi:Nucleic-acid-binding protein from transposon X-element [Eumeta japonica]|uniref:Nucleic-acid-binding protein from transposon X-element n=1 Tax=Eumeta variegata TaxID=151549 RepID=A0A4C1ZNT9_EUMVA|nr:Nucleic-acid-binding protein from transposon X-element [Eumeta japonica]
MDQDSPCSPGAGGSGPKKQITFEFIQQVLTKELSEIGYEAPHDLVNKLIARVTPVSSRASSRAASPIKTSKNKNKRQASSSSSRRHDVLRQHSRGIDEDDLRPAGDGHRPITGAHNVSKETHSPHNVCALSGIRVEAPHKRGVPSQCHRCQRYGHASANCYVQPRYVKCLVPHWTSECSRSKDLGDKPACVNCGQEHTANYGGCPKAPKIVSKPTNRTDKKLFNNKKAPPIKDALYFPALGAKKSLKTIDDRFAPAPMPSSNPWVKKQLPRTELEPSRETNRWSPPEPAPARQYINETSTFADDIQTVMSVLNTIKSSEISEFARDLRLNPNGNKLAKLSRKLKFDIVAPLTSTHYPDDLVSRPSTIDIAITKEIALNVDCIEPIYRLVSDHRPVLLRLGPPTGGFPKPMIKITDWKRVSTVLEEVDTPALNTIPDVIETTDEIDSSIKALTNYIMTVVKKHSWEVPASVDRRKLPADALELLRAKNAALRLAYVYPSREKRFRARALQRRALKSEGYLPTPPLKKPDSSLAVDDQEKAECIADSIELQCSHTLQPHETQHISLIEEEVRQKTSLDPLDDLSQVSLDEVQKLVKGLKAKKAPGLDGINTKTHSSRRMIRAGVPQGSALSHFVYTNDIPRSSSGVQLALFADDTALYLRGQTEQTSSTSRGRARSWLDGFKPGGSR